MMGDGGVGVGDGQLVQYRPATDSNTEPNTTSRQSVEHSNRQYRGSPKK